MWPVEPLKTDKREKHTRRHGDPKTVVTNILCENRRFRKVMKAAQRAGLLFETTTFFYSAIDLTATCQGERLRVEIIQRNIQRNYSKK